MHLTFSRCFTRGFSRSTESKVSLSITLPYSLRVFTRKKWNEISSSEQQILVRQYPAADRLFRALDGLLWKIVGENGEETHDRVSRDRKMMRPDATLMRLTRKHGTRTRGTRKRGDGMLALHESLLHPFYRSALAHPVSRTGRPSKGADAFTTKVAFQNSTQSHNYRIGKWMGNRLSRDKLL